MLAEKEVIALDIQKEIDFQNKSYISASASKIADFAALRAETKSSISKLQEYLKIHERFDHATSMRGKLELQKEKLDQQLEASQNNIETFKNRVLKLNENFSRILESFNPPKFGEDEQSIIDRKTYLPQFHGRRFDDISSPGLGTLVNIAHALAHQKTCIEQELLLPNILLIDGLSEHLGTEGLDPERLSAIYKCLIDFSDKYKQQLQMIIIDNEVPDYAKKYVRLELSEQDRLIH